MDVYVVQNRVLRLGETYSIKMRIKDSILTAELHLTRKEILFILENLMLMKKSYEFISETLFIPYPIPKFLKFSQQSSLSFFSLKIFEVQNPA